MSPNRRITLSLHADLLERLRAARLEAIRDPDLAPAGQLDEEELGALCIRLGLEVLEERFRGQRLGRTDAWVLECLAGKGEGR